MIINNICSSSSRLTPDVVRLKFAKKGSDTFSDYIYRQLPIFNLLQATQSSDSLTPEPLQCHALHA
jgi:hypothetical protein